MSDGRPGTTPNSSLIAALRHNAELADKSIDFMSDPDLAEEAREDADFWRRCAAEMERLGKAVYKLEEVANAAAELTDQPFGQLNERSFYRLREALDGI